MNFRYEQDDRPNPSGKTLAVMLMVVVTSPGVPIAVAISNAGEFPLLFAGMLGLLQGAGMFVWLFLFAGFRLTRDRVRSFIRQAAGYWDSANSDISASVWDRHPFMFSLIGRFGLAAYALSTRWIDPVVATLFLETGIIWLILLRRVDSGQRHENNVLISNRKLVLLLAVAFIGLAFAQFSIDGEIRIMSLFNIGALIATIAGLLDAVNIERSVKFGQNTLLEQIPAHQKDTELSTSVLLTCITNIITGLCFLPFVTYQCLSGNNLIGAFFNEIPSYIALILLLIVGPTATICMRHANTSDSTAELNLLRYLAPIGTIVILTCFAH